jgi:hypothetical protein
MRCARWVRSGTLTKAAAEAARGRPQPEQRRRKTLRTLARIVDQLPSSAVNSAAVIGLENIG